MTQLDTKERRKRSVLSYVLRVLFRALIFRWIGRSDLRRSSEFTLSTRVFTNLIQTQQMAVCIIPRY